MISVYIKELLKIHNRVIVPDLGAFLKKSENPNQIYFNEFLRFNDGLLVDYLAEKENVDKVEAAKQVKNFVAEINRSLKDKRFVDISEIGTLSLDSNEKIQLKIELLKAYVPEEQEQVKVNPEVKSEVVPEKPVKIEEVKNVEPETAPVKTKTGKSKKETIKETEIKTTVEPVKERIKETSFTDADTNEEIYYVEEKSGSKTFVWIGVAIALMLLVLAWIYIISPRLQKANNQNNMFVTDTSKVDSIKQSEPIAQPANGNNQNLGEPRYYVVAGCFAMEVNADNLVKELASKGYNAVKFTQIEELHYVAAGSFKTQKEAQKELNKAYAEGYAGCWILKFPN